MYKHGLRLLPQEIPIETRVEIAKKIGIGSSALDLGKEYGIFRKKFYNLVRKRASYGSLQNTGRKYVTNKIEDFSILEKIQSQVRLKLLQKQKT